MKLRVPRLFDLVFRKKLVEKSTSVPRYADMKLTEILKMNSFQSEEKKPINREQILIDCVAVTTMLQGAGYDPLDILVLLSKMYGSIIGTLPVDQTDLKGNKVDAKDLETNFFYACRTERKITEQKCIGVNTAVANKRLH